MWNSRESGVAHEGESRASGSENAASDFLKILVQHKTSINVEAVFLAVIFTSLDSDFFSSVNFHFNNAFVVFLVLCEWHTNFWF